MTHDVRTLRRSIAALAIVGAAVCALVAQPARATAPAGTATIARTSGNALVIWDASSDVATIVANKTSDSDADALLERDAARVLANAIDKLEKNATTVTLRVIYLKTGAVSPVYGTATFTGVERYARLELGARDAFDDRDHWRETTASAPLPPWFKFTVSGSLPER